VAAAAAVLAIRTRRVIGMACSFPNVN